ncbi:NAD(P)H oxidoreductase OS=Streptomyces tendae OX=1932 GN=GUR47_01050 PE=3 SV=1 [Streptomyces tendae]
MRTRRGAGDRGRRASTRKRAHQPCRRQSRPDQSEAGGVDRVVELRLRLRPQQTAPVSAGKRMLWRAWPVPPRTTPVTEGMRSLLEANLSEGIAYYCGFSHSAVGLLTDAEDRPQRVDAEGNLRVGDAVAGAEREARYADFDRRAGQFVEEFLAAEVPAA